MLFSFLASVTLAGLGVVSASPLALRTVATTTDYSNLTVAMVRAPPPGWPLPVENQNWDEGHFDLNGSVKYAVELIEQASTSGSNLIVFPEVWFPGFPKGLDEKWMAKYVETYINNSLIIGSAQWNTLLDAARANNMYLALGFSERTEDSIYMAQSLIDPLGNVLIHRQKLRPSGAERNLWSDGFIDGLKVVSTPFGRIGMLDCWEHFHPTMTFVMQAQLEDVHIATWPYQTDRGDALTFEAYDLTMSAVRTYALNSGATTVFTSIGYASVLNGIGPEVANISAKAPYDTQPLLIHSINTTDFKRKSYDVDGEQSWGALQQIIDSFPYNIPKVEGNFIPTKKILISSLLKLAENSTEASNTTLRRV